MLKKRIKSFAYRHIVPSGGLWLVKAIAATYRVRIVDPENESRFLENGKGLVYASWHQRFFPGITFFATRKPIAIMISQSRDGEYISRIVHSLGWLPVRGSSSRGGPEALQKIKELSAKGYKIGHIVDGPRGPCGIIKPGLLTIAQHAEIPIVPTITSGQKTWVFNSWDRFMVPRPFSRVIIRFGEPIFIPEDLHGEAFEEKRADIEARLCELYADTDRAWSDPERIKTIFCRREKPPKFRHAAKSWRPGSFGDTGFPPPQD